ncbi:MAG: polysaccharide deacetylase family protein [Candidatus Pacearchaeota archaeon]
MNRRNFIKRSILISCLFSQKALSQMVPITLPFDEEEESFKISVYLTIDDGPGKYMDRILENLGNNKAVFYIVGRSCETSTNFDLITKAIKSGHIIANHSYSHPNFQSLSLKSAEQEVIKTDRIIESAYLSANLERKIKLFRFPYGSVNSNFIPFLKEIGYRPVKSWDKNYCDWDLDTQDYLYGKLSGSAILSRCRKTKDNDIVLMHDMPRGLEFTANSIIPYYVNSGLYKLKIPM